MYLGRYAAGDGWRTSFLKYLKDTSSVVLAYFDTVSESINISSFYY